MQKQEKRMEYSGNTMKVLPPDCAGRLPQNAADMKKTSPAILSDRSFLYEREREAAWKPLETGGLQGGRAVRILKNIVRWAPGSSGWKAGRLRAEEPGRRAVPCGAGG